MECRGGLEKKHQLQQPEAQAAGNDKQDYHAYGKSKNELQSEDWRLNNPSPFQHSRSTGIGSLAANKGLLTADLTHDGTDIQLRVKSRAQLRQRWGMSRNAFPVSTLGFLVVMGHRPGVWTNNGLRWSMAAASIWWSSMARRKDSVDTISVDLSILNGSSIRRMGPSTRKMAVRYRDSPSAQRRLWVRRSLRRLDS